MNIQCSTKQAPQQGFALFTVLLMLLILGVVSVALIQNQRWSVRQTADRLDVLDHNAISSVTHDACVSRLHGQINPDSELRSEPIVGFEGSSSVISPNDMRWGDASNTCLYEFYQLPYPLDSGAQWAPQVRVNSRVQVNGVWVQELSEIRYPDCTIQGFGLVVCQNAYMKVQNGSGQQFEISVMYGISSPYISSRRKI